MSRPRSALALAFFSVLLLARSEASALGTNRTCRKFANRAVELQLDGYRHLEHVGVLRAYCQRLIEDFRAHSESRSTVRAAHRAARALGPAELDGNNPFHVLGKVFAVKAPPGEDLKELQHDRGFDVNLDSLNKCAFDKDTLAQDQICYHHLPRASELDPGKPVLVLLSTGGRRTGMTKMLALGKQLDAFLLKHFNVYSLTVEAKMLSREEENVKWKIAGTVSALARRIKRDAPHARPKFALAAYSYGGAHLIGAINEIFTRPSFADLRPDLLVFIDPDGALNTLEHLHLVPVAERIVNFRGVYIVPQRWLRFIGKMLSDSLDDYPSVEGSQPLVLLSNANYQEFLVLDPNGQDVSPHNRVPHNMVDYRDEEGEAVYMRTLEREFLALLPDTKGACASLSHG